MARLRKGDTVMVLTGKHRGKHGKILQMFPDGGKALVEHVNVMKHFERRTRADQPGGIIEREVPMSLDKLALVCPRCRKAARVRWVVAEGVKQRSCVKCREVIRV